MLQYAGPGRPQQLRNPRNSAYVPNNSCLLSPHRRGLTQQALALVSSVLGCWRHHHGVAHDWSCHPGHGIAPILQCAITGRRWCGEEHPPYCYVLRRLIGTGDHRALHPLFVSQHTRSSCLHAGVFFSPLVGEAHICVQCTRSLFQLVIILRRLGRAGPESVHLCVR